MTFILTEATERKANAGLGNGVNEMLRSTYAIYQSSGQHIGAGLLQLTPGTNNYLIVLPAPVSKGVYHVVVSNKKWTTTKTFVVL